MSAPSTWPSCAHRADFASAAEHDRDCPVHGLDALARDLLADFFSGPIALDDEVAVIVDHGSVKPPYGGPERAAYDREQSGGAQ